MDGTSRPIFESLCIGTRAEQPDSVPITTMPNSPYDLPDLPFSWRMVHLPGLPEVFRDFELGAPRGPRGERAVLPTGGDAQAARDRVERLIGTTWDRFRSLTTTYDGMASLAFELGHAERVLAEAKGNANEEDEAALSVVRFRHDVMTLVIDRYVVEGETETWASLPRGAKDHMWRNLRYPYTATQLEYLRAAERVYMRDREAGTVPQTRTALFEAIVRALPGHIRIRERAGPGGREEVTISGAAAERMFSRPPLDLWESGGPGRAVSREDVRAFLGRVHERFERVEAQAAGR